MVAAAATKEAWNKSAGPRGRVDGVVARTFESIHVALQVLQRFKRRGAQMGWPEPTPTPTQSTQTGGGPQASIFQAFTDIFYATGSSS